MAVAYVSAGTIGAGTTSVTPSAPASLANGDGVLIIVDVKPDTATVVVPDKWTLTCDVAGGGGTTGAAVGPTRQVHLFREKTAAFTVMPTITVTGGSGVAAQAYRSTKAAGTDWDVAGATGVYGTAGTVTNASATLGSDPGITSGDLVIVGASSMSVTPTWSAQSISATGATFGSITERTEALETSNGDDVGGMMFTAAVTAGTASTAATVGGTASAATRGTWALTRLREVTSPARTAPTIVDTKNVASFSTTTSPKTAGTFTAAVGDVLVDGVLDPQDDTTGGGNDNYAWSNTGGAQTWVELAETTGTGIADSWAQAAVAEVVSTVTAGDVSVSRSAGDLTTMWGHVAAQFSATAGVGNAASRTGVGGTPSGSITTLKPNSAVMVWMVDYAAVDYSSRTWTAINGFTPASGAGEVAYFRDSGGAVYTLAVAIYPDVGTAGAKTFGISSPTTGDWQWVAVEIQGTVSGGATNYNGTAASSSTATLSSDGIVGKAIGAVLAATVAITGTGVVGTSTGASVSETATVAAAGSVGKSATASLAATGTISAAGSVTAGVSSGATLAATDTISGAGLVGAASASTIAATGTLASTGVVGTSRTAAITGTDSLAATGVVGVASASSITATGAISAAGSVTAGGSWSAALAASDTVAATGVVGVSTGASLGATAAVNTSGIVGRSATSSLIATGAIAAAGSVTSGLSASATVSTTGTLAAAGVVGRSSSASLTQTATITAAGRVSMSSLASIGAAANLLASGSLGVSRGSSLTGSVTIAASGVVGIYEPPTEFQGRILAVHLSIATARGDLDLLEASAHLSTSSATGDLDTAEASARLTIAQATGVLT